VTALDPRLVSLTVVAAVAVYLVALRSPHRRARSDDMLAALATIELEIVEPGAHRTARLPLPILIGRAPQATLVLYDGQVSRLHARVDLEAGELSVRDLGSRNGTWVNARPIGEAQTVRPGDEIDVGATRIRLGGLVRYADRERGKINERNIEAPEKRLTSVGPGVARLWT
jgi:FHA domain